MTSFPGFRLDRHLGEGGSATVWLAVPDDGGPAVALKVPAPGAEHRIAEEAARLGAVDHPGVVRALALVGEGEALVLEHVEGGSLAERLARRVRLTPTEAVDVGVSLARTLDDLHRAGWHHGDVKPANVLLTPEGRPVLCDPACADEAGTDGYGADDVRALAVTLWELLAGALPRPGESLAEAAPGVPPALATAIEEALVTPRSAGDFARQLAGAILAVAPRRDTRTFGPRPPHPEPEPDEGPSRVRRLVPIAAAALVAALLAGPFSPVRSTGSASAADRPAVRLTPGAPADWDGSVLTGADGARYTLGVTGGEVVLGDWDCDGVDTPGHYEPATGEAVTFDGWASDGRPLPGERTNLGPGRHAAVAVGDGCDRLAVR